MQIDPGVYENLCRFQAQLAMVRKLVERGHAEAVPVILADLETMLDGLTGATRPESGGR